jgi:HK97 family phage prohead protease
MKTQLPGALEHKSSAAGFKDIDTTGRLMIGKFADYNKPDIIGDTCTKGMFDKTWREQGKKRVKHIYEHDTVKPIGLIQDLWDDQDGAYYKSFVPKTKFGDWVIEQATAGLIKEHSFGFIVKRSKPNDSGGRQITEVIHTEVTSVGGGYAIHGDTPLVAVKSFQDDTLEALSEKLNQRHKALSDIVYKTAPVPDNEFETAEQHLSLLLLEIKQLQQAIIDLKTISTQAAEEALASQTKVKSSLNTTAVLAAIELEKFNLNF